LQHLRDIATITQETFLLQRRIASRAALRPILTRRPIVARRILQQEDCRCHCEQGQETSQGSRTTQEGRQAGREQETRSEEARCTRVCHQTASPEKEEEEREDLHTTQGCEIITN
jgi:hypothetical protein